VCSSDLEKEYFIGYYFDCADGNYARTYNMQTKYGDYYDHIADIFKTLVFVYILYNSNIKTNTKICVFIIIIFFSIIMGLFLSHQEYIYNKSDESDTLKILYIITFDILKFNKKNVKQRIKYLRYFGPGTIQLLITLILIFLQNINKLF